jgi:lipoate-protein ligase A
MHSWRLLIHDPLPPPFALAIDEAIALHCTAEGGRPTLRFYQWDRPAISIGRFQPIEAAVRWADCRSANIPVLRRITGGRAVWHDRELTYSLVSPLPSLLFPPSLLETVALIGRALAAGLQQLGLPAHSSPPPVPDPSPRQPRRMDSHRSTHCFAEPAWYEVSVSGKKVIGSAQRRWRDRFLQQGSILLGYEPDAVTRWLNVDEADVNNAGGLLSVTAHPIDPDGLARLIARTMAERWGICIEEGALTREEAALADELVREKYGSPDWTVRADGPRRGAERGRAGAATRSTDTR